MVRPARARSIKALANQKAEDDMWGMPESPEFSSVQRLMNEFQTHAGHEERWLSNYRAIAKDAGDPLVRFLLDLIVADEERHHQLTSRMIAKLKDELAWTRSAVLARRVYPKGDAKRLLSSVESFVEAERKGIKEYQQLKRQSQGLYRDVFAMLYTTMIHDSHKHIGMLEFLRRKLKESEHDRRKGRTSTTRASGELAEKAR